MSKIKYLLLIIGIGFILRVAYSSYFPPSLNWDEVSLGYNAYALLKTGQDEWGQKLPNVFRAFGDYKLPVYVYLSVVPVAFLGLNPLSVRITSILAGSLLIFFSYLIARRIFSPRVGLISAFLIALSPWTFFMSRVALEANLGALFITMGAYFLLSNKLLRAILFLGLSAWTYNSARVFAPLFLITYFFLNRRRFKLLIRHYLLFVLLFVPVVIQLFSPAGQARYKSLSLIDSGAIARINELRSLPGGRLLYNKVTYFSYQFAVNYLRHFSPNFLFIKGGNHYQFSVQNFGLLYWICLPFFYLGLFKTNKFLLLWLLLAPIPGSLTRDTPHVLRAITMLPLPMIFTAVGLEMFKKMKLVSYLFCAGILVLVINYALVAKNYRNNFSWAWQYGYAQVVNYIKENGGKYDRIIFTKRYGEPHEFIAFFWPWDPKDFVAHKQWDYHDNWYWVNSLDKLDFINDWEMPNIVSHLPHGKKYLVISSPESPTQGLELFKINFLDNKPAFVIKEL